MRLLAWIKDFLFEVLFGKPRRKWRDVEALLSEMDGAEEGNGRIK